MSFLKKNKKHFTRAGTVAVAAGASMGTFIMKAGPEGIFWKATATVVLAVVAIGQPVIQWIGDEKESKKRRLDESLNAALATAIADITSKLKSLHARDVPEISANVFVVRGQTLERIARLRLAHRTTSGIVFTKGKGVVGRCWQMHEEVCLRVSELAEAYKNDPTTDILGMTSEELAKSRKYGMILAVPIEEVREKTFIGCISVDFPDRCADNTFDRDTVLTPMRVAATTAASILRELG